MLLSGDDLVQGAERYAVEGLSYQSAVQEYLGRAAVNEPGTGEFFIRHSIFGRGNSYVRLPANLPNGGECINRRPLNGATAAKMDSSFGGGYDRRQEKPPRQPGVRNRSHPTVW